jgi:hypothetical protein
MELNTVVLHMLGGTMARARQGRALKANSGNLADKIAGDYTGIIE